MRRDVLTDGQADMTKLIVAFRNFVENISIQDGEIKSRMQKISQREDENLCCSFNISSLIKSVSLGYIKHVVRVGINEKYIHNFN